MRPDETGTNHEINKHNPQTPDEVRAKLWQVNQRLYATIAELRQERRDLLDQLERLLYVIDYPPCKMKESRITETQNQITVTREQIESEQPS